MSVRRALSSASPSEDLILKLIAATAASTLLVASVIFYFLYRCAMARERQKNKLDSSFSQETPVHHKFTPQTRDLHKMGINECGNDVLYLHKLESGRLDSFSSISFNQSETDDSRRYRISLYGPTRETPSIHTPPNITNSTPSPGLPHLQSSQPLSHNVIPVKQYAPPPPLPPPPPPVLTKKYPVPPIPQVPTRIRPSVPPLPSLCPDASLKLRTDPRGKTKNTRAEASTEKSSNDKVEVLMKMKPLHWDKVTADVDHSVVWNEINAGSLRFDDKLIESLFGYNTSAQKPPETKNISSTSANSIRPAQIFILNPRRSQNTAIILKSLAYSSKEIQDAILEGEGLDTDTLEKLAKISPTEDETAKILQFYGNYNNLAYAEFFLYQILKNVPSPFIRVKAMLFRSNYDPEILHLKEALQTLEFGCKELRARGLFLKLLEAILRAGNHMNAGTIRGNAKGFNLTALQKISYIKSTDGKITLLQFVVEHIALAEGKRCTNSSKSGSSNIQYNRYYDQDSNSHTETELSEKEYLKLGLSVFDNLSTEFSNVKVAASLNPDALMNQCSNLTFCVSEIQQLMNQCGIDERGNFVKEMKGFIEECKEELQVIREEQTRVMQMVKRTTEFYQPGACNDKQGNPFQIFVLVRDFLDMVDHACTDITRKHQKTEKTVRSSPQTLSMSMAFQKLPLYATAEKLSSNSFSNSEDDFCKNQNI